MAKKKSLPCDEIWLQGQPPSSEVATIRIAAIATVPGVPTGLAPLGQSRSWEENDNVLGQPLNPGMAKNANLLMMFSHTHGRNLRVRTTPYPDVEYDDGGITPGGVNLAVQDANPASREAQIM
jgi:hypothetical protein